MATAPLRSGVAETSSSKYVGLDVHQATALATVRQASGKIIARSILPIEEAARRSALPSRGASLMHGRCGLALRRP